MKISKFHFQILGAMVKKTAPTDQMNRARVLRDTVAVEHSNALMETAHLPLPFATVSTTVAIDRTKCIAIYHVQI